MSDLTDVGTGVNLFTAGEVRGTARWFHDTSDVLSIDDDDLEDTVAFVNKGGMTFLSPILPDLRAIVCTAGSRESHLAILSRESDVPCVLAAELNGEIADGAAVVLDLTDAETARIAVSAGGVGVTTTAPSQALLTDASYEPTLEEWNWLVHEGGAAYKSELTSRTVFESELFGMNTYILMSMMEDYLRVPDRIRTILSHATPAELVRKALPIGNKRSFINLAAMPLHYLTGRELYVDLGENSLADGLEDQLEVMRFWRQATIAMRTDGVLYNMQADPANSSHVVGDELMAQIRGHLVPADAEHKSAIRKFGARLTAYAFLENCDARTAVCDTGPYQLEDGTFLALRETCADGDGDFPWLDGIRETLPFHHFVIAHQLPSSVKMDNNVWGTAWFTPSDYQADIIATRVFCTDGGTLRPLELGDLAEATSAIRKAHRALYERLAGTDPEERNLYATSMYAWKLKAWARLAGCYDEIDWAVSPSIQQSYEKFQDPNLALQLIGGVFVPQDRDSCFRPLGG